MTSVLALAVFGTVALGQNAVSFRALTTVSHGEQAPYLEFEISEPGDLKAGIACAGKRWDVARRVGQGDTVRLELTGVAKGSHDCTGEMVFTLDRGEVLTQGLDLTVASVSMIEWTIDYSKDWNRQTRTFTAHADRPLVKAQASFIGAHGKQVDWVQGDLSDPANPTFTWTTTDTMVKVEVEAIDESQFKGLLELFPYWYSIPHEDPVFDSGSHTVNNSEVPKLNDTWEKIVEQFELYGSVVQMDLYVAGYTDTQGDAGSNQGLSERRAKAIAQWFRAAGFTGQVFYQGFGEDALAVKTADGVDEVANRRVVYFLANQAPPPGPDVPRTSWRKL